MRIFETSIEKTERVEKDGRIRNMSYLKKYPELTKIEFDEGQKNNIEQLKKLVSNPSIEVIGLEGKWGTGKSTILEALQDGKNCYVYDLWAHQEDNLRYSFSKGMLDNFKPQDESQKEDVETKISFDDLKKKANDLISTRNESSPSLNMRMAGLIFVLLFLPVLANIADVLWEDKPSFYIVASLCIPVLIVSLWYTYTEKKINLKNKETLWYIFTKKQYSWSDLITSLKYYCIEKQYSYSGLIASLKYYCTEKQYSWFPILVFLFIVVVAGDIAIGFTGRSGVVEKIITDLVKMPISTSPIPSGIWHLTFSGLQFLLIGIFLFIIFKNFKNISKKNYVSDALSLYNGNYVETSYSTTVYPRMEDVQEFMVCFEKFLKERGIKHYIIIFDNLDRLPNDKIKEFWTFLQTFFVEKRDDKRTVIVAFDRERVIEAFDNEQIGKGYLEKSLDITLNVPECTRFDLKRFFLERWDLAFQDFEFKKKIRMYEDIKQAGSNAFEIFFQQSLSKSPSIKPSNYLIGSHTRRSIVEFINDIYLKIEAFVQLFPTGMIKVDRDMEPIKYPVEMVSLFVVKKDAINRMFSETVDSDSTRYYIDAYGDYQDWIDVFVPGSDEEEKKLILQVFCNALILNKLDDQYIYSLRKKYKDGQLEFYCKWIGIEEDIEKEFNYLFNYALQRIDGNEDVLNLAKSLIYCRKKIEKLEGEIEDSWLRLFVKMKRMKFWPSESWFWNAFLSDAKKCLKEIVPPDDHGFSDKREFFIVEIIRSRLNQNAGQEKKQSEILVDGKVCLPSTYLTEISWNFSKHTIEKDGQLFFYDGDNEKEVVEQLKKLDVSDWERSLESFWNPGILQLDKVKNKSRCKLDYLDEAVKKFFENYMNVMKNGTYEEKLKLIHFDDTFRWGPLNETDYFKKWERIILHLNKSDRKRLFGIPNIDCCFPDGMLPIIKKIMENDGAES